MIGRGRWGGWPWRHGPGMLWDSRPSRRCCSGRMRGRDRSRTPRRARMRPGGKYSRRREDPTDTFIDARVRFREGGRRRWTRIGREDAPPPAAPGRVRVRDVVTRRASVPGHPARTITTARILASFDIPFLHHGPRVLPPVRAIVHGPVLRDVVGGIRSSREPLRAGLPPRGIHPRGMDVPTRRRDVERNIDRILVSTKGIFYARIPGHCHDVLNDPNGLPAWRDTPHSAPWVAPHVPVRF